MTQTHKNKPRKNRVIQRELPTERLHRPARGDWSRWEATARRQMRAAHKAAAL